MSEATDKLKRQLALKIGAGAVALAVPLVASLEGTVLRTYRDPIGILTSCRGHTGPELKPGQVFTVEQCDVQELQDLIKHADDLACIKAPLSEGEKAAMLSFSFNVGRGKAGVKDGLCVLKSGQPSSIVRKFNAGDHLGACAALMGWTFAGGKDCKLPENRGMCGGLVKRRELERDVCLGKRGAQP
jgi:lysozyme